MAFWKGRAQRAVYDTAGKCLKIARLGLALDVASGDSTCCVHLFDILHGKGQKVLLHLRLFARYGS